MLDLSLRHGLTPAEVAEVVGTNRNAANQMVHRARNRLGDAIRARVLWRGGEPECGDLADALQEAHVTRFDADAVRVTTAHAETCERCQERRRLRLDPAALFAAVPMIAAPTLLKTKVADRSPPKACRWATRWTNPARARRPHRVRRVLALVAAAAAIVVVGLVVAAESIDDDPAPRASLEDVRVSTTTTTVPPTSTTSPIPPTSPAVVPTTAPGRRRAGDDGRTTGGHAHDRGADGAGRDRRVTRQRAHDLPPAECARAHVVDRRAGGVGRGVGPQLRIHLGGGVDAGVPDVVGGDVELLRGVAGPGDLHDHRPGGRRRRARDRHGHAHDRLNENARTPGGGQVMTTGVPSGSVDSFMITSLFTRTHPCDTGVPMVPGSLVPWTAIWPSPPANSLSMLLWPDSPMANTPYPVPGCVARSSGSV